MTTLMATHVEDRVAHDIRRFERGFDEADWTRLRDQYKDWVTTLTAVTLDEYCRDLPYIAERCPDDPRLASFAERYVETLSPFLQGPVLLPGGKVHQSAWDVRYKPGVFQAAGVTRETVLGKRVVDLGCNAGFDTMYLASLGAAEAIGVEPSAFVHQASFLKTLYGMHAVSYLRCGWQDLNPATVGRFDVVNCQGLIYHEKNPVGLLERAHALLEPGGLLVVETHALPEPGRREISFIEDAFWGDSTYWFIFGEQAILGLLRRLGFEDVRLIGNTPCHSRNPADPERTVEGHPAGSRLLCTARRAAR